MTRTLCALILAAALAPAAVLAHDAPQLSATDPVTIDPAAGSVTLTVYGKNIPPDAGNHSDYTQYWHIFVRTIGADGAAGPWTHCDGSQGCGLSGFSASLMQLKVDVGRWGRAGSTFQMHYFTGLNDSDVSEPSDNRYGQDISPWSNIVSWKAQAPVVSAPPAPPAPFILLARRTPIIPVAAPPAVHPRIQPQVQPRVVPLLPKPTPTPTRVPNAK